MRQVEDAGGRVLYSVTIDQPEMTIRNPGRLDCGHVSRALSRFIARYTPDPLLNLAILIVNALKVHGWYVELFQFIMKLFGRLRKPMAPIWHY